MKDLKTVKMNFSDKHKVFRDLAKTFFINWILFWQGIHKGVC